MKAFIDSSVLVAAFSTAHPFYEDSIKLLTTRKSQELYASTHSLAEVYASITRLPLTPRPLPEHAMRFIRSIAEKITWVTLTRAEYMEMLDICVARQLRGGKIYDALLLQAALKISVATLYTWNSRDFEPLAAGTDIIIRTPRKHK